MMCKLKSQKVKRDIDNRRSIGKQSVRADVSTRASAEASEVVCRRSDGGGKIEGRELASSICIQLKMSRYPIRYRMAC